VEVKRKHLKVGIKGKEPVADGELAEEVKVESVNWVIEDKKAVVLNMDKVNHNNI
jgi:hypothetical protein